MEENSMQRDPDAAEEKRKSGSLATAVATLCSRLWKGCGAQRRDNDAKPNVPGTQAPSRMADISAASELDDLDLDRLAGGVFDRLMHIEEGDVLADPQAALFAIARDVARKWPVSTTRKTESRADPFTGPADLALLRRSVAELEAPCRATLMRHVNEGLTYLQIAEHCGVSPDLVLAQLRTAYSQLRLSLAGCFEGTSGLPVETKGNPAQ